MTQPDSFPTPPLTGCDALQARLSEVADSGAPLPPDLRAHLDECDACALFAEQWLSGPPAALARPVADEANDALRERILDAVASPTPANVVPFAPAASHRASWNVWLGRAAACAAIAGLGYWLLNPTVTPAGGGLGIKPKPTLAQTLSGVETQAVREREIVGGALRDGGQQVRQNVVWSASALDL